MITAVLWIVDRDLGKLVTGVSNDGSGAGAHFISVEFEVEAASGKNQFPSRTRNVTAVLA